MEQAIAIIEDVGKDQAKLNWLARAQNYRVRRAIAGFKYAPEDALEFLAEHSDFEERRALGTEGLESDDLRVARSKDASIKSALAKNEGMSALALYELTEAEVTSLFEPELFERVNLAGESVRSLEAEIRSINERIAETRSF